MKPQPGRTGNWNDPGRRGLRPRRPGSARWNRAGTNARRPRTRTAVHLSRRRPSHRWGRL